MLCLSLLSGTSWSHELKLESRRQGATVVRLTYADGQPFAFEAYELYVWGKDVPAQVGRTTSQGEVVFLPGGQTEWRLKAYSADGHGVDQVLEVSADSAGATPRVAADLPRPLLWACGLGIVFGLFGLLQLVVRRRKS